MVTTKANRLTVTIDEAAEILGIGRTLAYEMVRRGELPHLRLGPRKLVVPKKALDQLLESAEPAVS